MFEDFEEFVSRGTLNRDAPKGSDHGAKLARSHILAEIRACRFGDALFHQRAAEIVGARFEAG